jgi:hypothetical protein
VSELSDLSTTALPSLKMTAQGLSRTFPDEEGYIAVLQN